jgi:hypothetical protein
MYGYTAADIVLYTIVQLTGFLLAHSDGAHSHSAHLIVNK